MAARGRHREYPDTAHLARPPVGALINGWPPIANRPPGAIMPKKLT